MNTKNLWFMPDESEPHECTWMAFPGSEDIWDDLLPDVQENVALIARTIVKYEPVRMLVWEEDYEIAEELCGPNVELIVFPIDDLWMRDTGPVFVIDDVGNKAGIDFNFNAWGGKREIEMDAEVARFVSEEACVPTIRSTLCLEGGGIEVDGHGTAIISESCVLNPNRNPGVSKAECETELKSLLGLRKIIWLPGIAGQDITDGHTDGYARFAGPGVVLVAYEPSPMLPEHAVTERHLEVLHNATDADGRRLEVIPIDNPQYIRPEYETEEFAAGYINFYVINDAVIAPQFGDRRADRNAKAILEELFPERDIIQLNIDAIAAGGGGIHCTTQQEPAV